MNIRKTIYIHGWISAIFLSTLNVILKDKMSNDMFMISLVTILLNLIQIKMYEEKKND